MESGALTCTVLRFILLHSSSVTITLLADEHIPSQPCCALHIA